MLNTLLLDKLALVADVVVKVYKPKHIFGENISIEYSIGASTFVLKVLELHYLQCSKWQFFALKNF